MLIFFYTFRAGAITNTAKSLDLLRQLLQKFINQEIDCIIRKYLQVTLMSFNSWLNDCLKMQ